MGTVEPVSDAGFNFEPRPRIAEF